MAGVPHVLHITPHSLGRSALLRELEEADARFLAAAQRCRTGVWVTLQIVSNDPGLEAGAAFIRRKLSTIGLIEDARDADENSGYRLTDLGCSGNRWLRSLAEDTGKIE